MKIGFFGILQLYFLIMKFGEIGAVATWSWWLVLLPTLIPLAFLVILIMMLGLFAVYADNIKKKIEKRKFRNESDAQYCKDIGLEYEEDQK